MHMTTCVTAITSSVHSLGNQLCQAVGSVNFLIHRLATVATKLVHRLVMVLTAKFQSTTKGATLLVMLNVVAFSMLAAAAAELPAQDLTPEAIARQRFNQVFVKVIVPVTSDTPKQDGPAIESWIAEQLKQMGQTEYFAVTDWVPVCDGLLEDDVVNNDVWDGRLNGKERYCPVGGDIPERDNGQLLLKLGGWWPVGVEMNIRLPDEPGWRAVHAVELSEGPDQEPVKVDKQLPFVAVTIAPALQPRLTSESKTSLEKQFSAIVRLAAKDKFSGIVVAERQGTILASYSVGLADPNSKLPIDKKTLFEIGSVTKPITALAVIVLDRKGRLSLDDSISEHLPNVPENCRDITIRHLLQHTSGIPGTNYGPHSTDVSETTKAYLQGGPRHKPGTRFEYWNQGYALLAAIIAKVTGQTYQEAIRELVFQPAGMKASCFTGDKPPEGFQVSIGQSTQGANRSALDHPYGNSYGLQYQGMGGIVSNIDDMLGFVKTVRASGSDAEKMLQVGPDGNYGLGWRIEPLNESHRRVFHSGSVRGFLASVSWYPELDSSFIVLANTDANAGFFQVESSCRQAFEATIVPLPEDQRFDEEFRDSVIGKFTLQSRVVTVSQVGEGLQMVIDWGGPKTFGKLAKTSSPDRLRYLDGSGENIVVSLSDKNSSHQFESLQILTSTYTRQK